MSNDYELKRLRALLEGLECQNIDDMIADATPDVFRMLGERITKAAKCGAMIPPDIIDGLLENIGD